MRVITTLRTALVVIETVSLYVITPKPHEFIISGFNRRIKIQLTLVICGSCSWESAHSLISFVTPESVLRVLSWAPADMRTSRAARARFR